ncbi:MAG TPA: TROVE domain-containing protein [Tepidisphaeraceae bacterium]|jgi:60 kDa SS-A/Ro ribonucleoprotein|nr:TROVE domain-containing protein [Tepidisphaeraceae bacterium]
MASKTLFQSLRGMLLPAADTRNEAGGLAYTLPPKHALAQYAATGCLNATFYASADEQLATVLELCKQVEPEFIARTALYARSKGYMKDLPALLCAVLASRGPGLLAEVFDRVIDDAKMLRNFVQIIRSGVTGRKSLGTLPKRLVLQWFEARDDAAIFRASVGNDPSLADVIKMVHPKPATKGREALFGYLIGRPHNAADLPEIVMQYEAFKAQTATLVPDVPFQMLTSLPLSEANWKDIARNAPWQMTRMNLNTFARHGVFADAELARLIADRLRNPELIVKAKVFPYQLMVAYTTVDAAVPQIVREALQDAMEVAISNVPRVKGDVYVFVDVSGSMQSPVTGHRTGSTTAVRCLDAAALLAASIVRQNPHATVLPFSDDVVYATLNPRDSVMSNAKLLASLPSGGTNCSAPLKELNRRQLRQGLEPILVYVSDNQSWIDSPLNATGQATATMKEWSAFKARNPSAKMVCVDIQPYGTVQAQDRPDVLNIGGFSDRVFDVIAKFADGTLGADHWVGVIEAMAI